MTKGEALNRVASTMAAILGAGDLEEATGIDPIEQEQMSEADLERLEWAMEEVQRRLYRMGSQR